MTWQLTVAKKCTTTLGKARASPFRGWGSEDPPTGWLKTMKDMAGRVLIFCRVRMSEKSEFGQRRALTADSGKPKPSWTS